MNFGFNQYPTMGGQYYGGYGYGGMIGQNGDPKFTMTQGLTKEQLDALRKNTAFSLEISEEDLWRSFCTHRDEKSFKVSVDDEGNMICALCGTKFKPFNGDINEAREVVNKCVDLMETTKMQAINLPPNTIKEFFQIEPLIKKLPELYSRSVSDVKRVMPSENYVNGYENNAFSYYQNMINPMGGNGYMDPAMMQQPVYGAPTMQYNYAPQPMMQQQPMYGQPMQQPQQMYNQPMMQQQQPMYGQPMQQPQGNPFNINSAPVTAPAPQPTVAAPAQGDQVTVTKTLTD